MTTQAINLGIAAPSWAWLRRLTCLDRARRPSPPMLDRLAAAIAEQEHLLASVMCLRTGYTPDAAALSAQIDAWLQEAKGLLRNQALLEGWQRIYDARAAMIRLFPDDMVEAHRASLREQAAATLKDGTRRAAENLLSRHPSGAADVAEAQRIVDDHFKGVDVRTAHTRTQLFYLPFALAAMLITLLCVSAAVDPPRLVAWSTIGDTPLLIWAYVFGALGAVLSLTLGTIHGVTRENYLVVTGPRLNATRPLLGAASAAAVVVILETNLLNLDGPPSDRPVLLAAALAAGFSERLLTTAINAVVRAEPKK
jgi:hypothetical protein